ncbi:OR6M1 [Branchiostoma lanceolatum]|uniref:OR6M1 protein n=1 Tax=Branchiostoma lanceolatum TaxID=7740 RepID=A0A8J9ZKZ0_BRALA|nr:OR6M1 [Branchiostoma lanceolatum]
MEGETDGPLKEDGVNHVPFLGSTSRDLQTTYLVFSLVLSVGSGLLLIFLVWKKDRLQKPSYFLRCNLAVDDIIFTSCLIPIRIYALFRQDEHLFCSARSLVAPVFLLSMSGTYLMMAIDLYHFVCNPLHYHDKVTTKRVAVGILTIRAFSLFFGLAPVAFGGLPENSLFCEYDPANSADVSAIFRNINLFVFLLATLSALALYCRVFKEARRQQERDENRDLWVFQTKAFKMMAPHAIVLTVSVTTIIFQVAMARALISKEQMLQYALIITDHVAILLFLTVSSMANPIIHSFRLPEFRRACKEMCGLPRNQPVAPAPRHRDMGIAAIAGPGQGAPATELTPTRTSAKSLKPTVKDAPSDQAQKQTQADMGPGLAHGTECRDHRNASERPFQLTVRAEVHAEPTPCSGEYTTETLPEQLLLDAESAHVPTSTFNTETDGATVGHTVNRFASEHRSRHGRKSAWQDARPKSAWQEDPSQCIKGQL